MSRIGRGIPARAQTAHATFSDHLAESFDKSDSDILGPDLVWSELSEDVDIVSNEARFVPVGTNLGRARAAHLLVSWDMWAQGRFTVSEEANFARGGVAVRMNSASPPTFYFFQLDFQGNQVRFFRSLAGVSTEIASASGMTLIAGTYYEARFEIQGFDLRGHVDGTLVLSFTDTDVNKIATGEFAGFALAKSVTGNAVVDDFEAGTIFASVTTLTITTPGVLTFAGQTINATISGVLTAGALTFSGQTITTAVAVTLQITTPGVLTFAGQTINATFKTPVAVGTLVFSGQSITTTVITGIQITTPGSLTFSGQALPVVTTTPVTPGALAFAGQSITTRVAVVQTVTPGALTFAGQTILIRHTSPVAPGALTFAGQTITTAAVTTQTVTPGALTFAGQIAAMRLLEVVAPGALVFSGQVVTTASVSPFIVTITREGPKTGGAASGTIITVTREGDKAGGAPAGPVRVVTRSGA